ncbi:NUDIX domain-containing protein [Limimaricola pyoseonensis]|uniref:8-oxo-dGTP diphosphatase n=1 Tax=Limimaricola pyoseonensis TaxID=521013 RepID=A0A1G7F7U3_9RHOB|nr:NUDIX hydrolase [Limimaricola pyoseonensis]SDE71625.1 8-oxo-dGTP diphosphatase [Limimaricola pyoseonensis]
MATGYSPRRGGESFDGAKAALFLGSRLLVIRRDDRPGISFPGALDFPGGGREGAETPDETLAREMREEVGLEMARAEMLWRRPFDSATGPGKVWFFVLRMGSEAESAIRFGDEGQGWSLMAPEAFLAAPDAVPALQARLRLWQAL